MAPKKSNKPTAAQRSMTMTKAFDTMIFERRSDLSPHTISDYIVTGKHVLRYFQRDPLIIDLERADWIGFFNHLCEQPVSPAGIAARPTRILSSKTRRNIHTNLSALYTWLVKAGHIETNLIRTIDRPGAKQAPRINPFTHAECAALFEACEYTARWSTGDTRSERHTALRDKLILKTLLDTGIRAQELCDIKIKYVSLSQKSIVIPHGKGDKRRTVHFGNRTSKLMWEHLDLSHGLKPDDYLFSVDDEHQRPLTRDSLRRLVQRLGDRAGVANVHPHRFRHTFATEYLRNGGQLLSLKDLLGHSDFEMVEHYAHFVQADVKRDHQSASPIDNWKI
jgi:integrase/recombinase XerD